MNTCRTCKNIDECNIDKEKRQAAWPGDYLDWTCGYYQEAENYQITWDEVGK